MATQTFLQLPPELGGLRFGPFEQWVQIGSDPKRCQIVLDPAHGVFPMHCTIGLMPDGRYSVSPNAAECKVFLMPQGQAQVWPITSPVQASSGDMVIFGTPSGPRFQILQQGPAGAAPSAREIVAAARQTGGERGFVQGVTDSIDAIFRPSRKGGIQGEIQRRAQARMIAGSGPMRNLYVFWTRFRSGSFNNPYYIVAAISAVIGLIGTGSVSCTGILVAVWSALGLTW
jgi:hypothetical protein